MVEGDQQSARAEEDRKRFALHDLRAYYVTRRKAERGALPDLHANPATTARVYDRAKIVRRRACNSHFGNSKAKTALDKISVPFGKALIPLGILWGG
ncbi:hypothetical protein [Burkholderia ubonensis]|uniref:hypothetical protein n=1 Tax=Burkholderia ubonensis TaxID=101571 RepID=UPI000B235178|nr:hypothetical protein [Burkholderia ubonensis]